MDQQKPYLPFWPTVVGALAIAVGLYLLMTLFDDAGEVANPVTSGTRVQPGLAGLRTLSIHIDGQSDPGQETGKDLDGQFVSQLRALFSRSGKVRLIEPGATQLAAYRLEGTSANNNTKLTLYHESDQRQVLKVAGPVSGYSPYNHVLAVAQQIIGAVVIDARRNQPSAFKDISYLKPGAREHLLGAQEAHLRLVRGETGDWPAYIARLEAASASDPHALTAFEKLVELYAERGSEILGYERASNLARERLDTVLDLTPKRYGFLYQQALVYLLVDLSYERAERIFKRGLMRQADAGENQVGLVRIALREGRVADARRKIGEARNYSASDVPTLLAEFAQLALVTGDASGDHNTAASLAMAAAQDSLSIRTRAVALGIAADAAVLEGRQGEAQLLVDEAWTLLGAVEPLRFAATLAATGREERARQLLIETVPGDSFYDVARAHLALGDNDAALAALAKGVDRRDIRVLDGLRLARYWGVLRHDVRFASVLQSLQSLEAAGATSQVTR